MERIVEQILADGQYRCQPQTAGQLWQEHQRAGNLTMEEAVASLPPMMSG